MKTKTGKLLTGSLLLAGVMLLNAFCDSKQDKDTYKSVKIGNQEWMTENLNVSTFRNGDLIPHAVTVEKMG
ncbi:MAG: hypothetical protein K8S16_22155 [Bacteroidales bacterium]|nr:hypothetical protein [Bacteroidales bacterium]